MGVVGQSVDDRATAVLDQVVDGFVEERPDDDHVDILAEDAAEIGQAFAGAEADVVSQEQAAAAEVDHAGFEADARPQRRLFEQQGHHAAGQQRLAQSGGVFRLQIFGDGEDAFDFVGLNVGQSEQVSHGVANRSACGSPRPECRSRRAIGRSVRFIAGNSRSTVFCVQLTSSPRSRQASTTGGTLDRQLDPDHQSQNPHFADQFALLGQRRQPLAEQIAQLAGVLEQMLLLDHFDGGQPGAGGQRIAAKGGRVHAGAQAGSDFGRGQQGPAGNAAAQRLGQRHHVGRDAEVLIGEPLAGAAAAGLHFVEHQQNLVVVGQLAQSLQEAVGRNDHAPFALHRLDQDGRGLVVDQAAGRRRDRQTGRRRSRPSAGPSPS